MIILNLLFAHNINKIKKEVMMKNKMNDKLSLNFLKGIAEKCYREDNDYPLEKFGKERTTYRCSLCMYRGSPDEGVKIEDIKCPVCKSNDKWINLNQLHHDIVIKFAKDNYFYVEKVDEIDNNKISYVFFDGDGGRLEVYFDWLSDYYRFEYYYPINSNYVEIDCNFKYYYPTKNNCIKVDSKRTAMGVYNYAETFYDREFFTREVFKTIYEYLKDYSSPDITKRYKKEMVCETIDGNHKAMIFNCVDDEKILQAWKLNRQLKNAEVGYVVVYEHKLSDPLSTKTSIMPIEEFVEYVEWTDEMFESVKNHELRWLIREMC